MQQKKLDALRADLTAAFGPQPEGMKCPHGTPWATGVAQELGLFQKKEEHYPPIELSNFVKQTAEACWRGHSIYFRPRFYRVTEKLRRGLGGTFVTWVLTNVDLFLTAEAAAEALRGEVENFIQSEVHGKEVFKEFVRRKFEIHQPWDGDTILRMEPPKIPEGELYGVPFYWGPSVTPGGWEVFLTSREAEAAVERLLDAVKEWEEQASRIRLEGKVSESFHAAARAGVLGKFRWRDEQTLAIKVIGPDGTLRPRNRLKVGKEAHWDYLLPTEAVISEGKLETMPRFGLTRAQLDILEGRAEPKPLPEWQENYLLPPAPPALCSSQRRGGMNGRSRNWVIRPDGTEREADHAVVSCHDGPTSDGQVIWWKLHPEELVLKWKCGWMRDVGGTSEWEVVQHPEVLTKEQLQVVSSIEEELGASPYDPWGFRPEIGAFKALVLDEAKRLFPQNGQLLLPNASNALLGGGLKIFEGGIPSEIPTHGTEVVSFDYRDAMVVKEYVLPKLGGVFQLLRYGKGGCDNIALRFVKREIPQEERRPATMADLMAKFSRK